MRTTQRITGLATALIGLLGFCHQAHAQHEYLLHGTEWQKGGKERYIRFFRNATGQNRYEVYTGTGFKRKLLGGGRYTLDHFKGQLKLIRNEKGNVNTLTVQKALTGTVNVAGRLVVRYQNFRILQSGNSDPWHRTVPPAAKTK